MCVFATVEAFEFIVQEARVRDVKLAVAHMKRFAKCDGRHFVLFRNDYVRALHLFGAMLEHSLVKGQLSAI